MTPLTPLTPLAPLWHDAGLDPATFGDLALGGRDPLLPSSFAIGAMLQTSLAAAALAAATIGQARGGPRQEVSLEMADVLCEASGRFTLDGRTLQAWDKLAGLYRCADGWVRLHTNFAHHRDRVLALLGLPEGEATERAAVAAALATWPAEAFESAAAAAGAVVAALRSPPQWAAHPQAAAVAGLPLVDIAPIGAAGAVAACPWWPGDAGKAPLRGLRVLDLTRILAGPVAGRTLAAYGADVLLVNGPHLPNIEAIADTSRGKLSAHVDLRDEAGRATLRALIAEADVVLHAYRPGALAALGFTPEAMAALRPGIVCVGLSAYGHAGPWADRRGFDSLVQSATGLNIAEAEAFGDAQPRALPLQALDYGAGWLLAFGALAALLRQRREGGSWQVRVALARVAHWLAGLPRVTGGPAGEPIDLDGALQMHDSGFGRLAAMPHAVRMSAFKPGWARPSMPPGSHPPIWPPR